MEERTIIISSRDLVDHTVLTRRKNELSFKRDLLLRSGCTPEDMSIKVLCGELAQVESKLSPVAEKVGVADLVTVVPGRREIGEYTTKINQYSRAELDLTIRKKSGEAYELMRKRAELVKGNYERREDIARLVVMLNSLPRKDAEALAALVEEGQGSDVDVSFLPKEKQQELVNLVFRIGRPCSVFAGSFSLDKKKAESAELRPADEVSKLLPGGRRIWIDASKVAEFDSNEKELSSLLAKIQAKNAEKQARTLTEEESVYFDKIQGDYLAALSKRNELASGIDLKESVKVYKKGIPPAMQDPY